MLKREEKALRELIVELRTSTAMAYSSNPEFEDGIDIGRERAADELEYLLTKLLTVPYKRK